MANIFVCRYGSELQRKILRYSDKGAAKLLFRFTLKVQTKVLTIGEQSF